MEEFSGRILLQVIIKFPDIEGRDEGSKIKRRLPTGRPHFKFNWLIFPLRPSEKLTQRQITPSLFLSHITVLEFLKTSNDRKIIRSMH